MNIRLFAFFSLLFPILASAEVRTFTNTAGKKIEAELIGMQKGAAVLRLANGRTANVPLKSLSEADQNYVNSWYAENKNKVNAGDIRMTIKKNTERVKSEVRKRDKEKGNQNRNKNKSNNKSSNKSSKTETSFTCTLENLSSKTIERITASYVIYERVSVRGDSGSETRTEETSSVAEVGPLEAKGKLDFESDSEISEDSETKKKDASETRRESVVGFVVALKVGENEILKQSYPDNFLKRLEEEAKRKAAREKDRK